MWNISDDFQQSKVRWTARWSDRLKRLGNLRDGFLVAAAVFYLFGYLIWSINAYRNGLGLLPALDLQYLVAGAGPVLIILIAVSIAIGTRQLRKKALNWTGWKLNLCWIAFGCSIIALGSFFIILSDWFKERFPSFPTEWPIIFIALIITITGYIFLDPLEKQIYSDKKIFLLLRPLFTLIKGLGRIYAYFLLPTLPLVAFIFFVETWYPNLPQEFGGARPIAACLDVTKAELSQETIKDILPPGAGESSDPVAHSVKIEILFSGNDRTIIRSQGKIYKIDNAIIKAVSTCD
jgi:hypothetical protein